MSDTQHKSINRTKIDRRIDKHFMQSYWSALQFPPTNLPVLYRGMPQASHGIILNAMNAAGLNLISNNQRPFSIWAKVHEKNPLLLPKCSWLLLTFWGAFREIFRKRVIFGKTPANYISPKR